MTKTDLAGLVDAKLAESGLDAAAAKRLGMRAVTAAEARRLSPSFAERAALRLDYHCAEGRPTGFYRLRYLGKATGFAASAAKPQRYTQPPDTDAEVYLARGHGWPAVFADPSVALHITEGELKAACGCEHGFPVMGLGGVWSWRSAKKGLPLLPLLKSVAWKGRRVYVAYDSDSVTNPDVARAQSALCEALTAEGALPSVVSLPALEGGRKTGLDDLIVALGPEAYQAAVDAAQPYAAARGLWALNAEVAYVRDPGIVVALEDGLRWTPQGFTGHAYANRHHEEQRVRKDGSVTLERVPTAKAWLEWPLRGELAALAYAPGEPQITADRRYNFWKGWGCEPSRGDVGPWKALLDFLFRGEPASRQWFERWCAAPLQRPGLKLYSAAVLWGVRTGTGKSLAGTTVMRIYGENAKEITERELGSQFNEWAQHRQFVMGDDVASKEHRASSAEAFKTMITQGRLTINAKHLPTYTLRDCINYLFTGNHPDAFYLEDFDRRFFVHEVVGEPMPREFYRKYVAWLNGGGPSHLFHHLLRLPLGDFDAEGAALETAAKRAMVLDGKSDLGTWVARLLEDPGTALKIGDVPARSAVFTAAQLLRIYDPEGSTRVTANGMGRELKRAGFRLCNGGASVRTRSGPARLYAIRDTARWLAAPARELAAEWEGAPGQQSLAAGPGF